MEKKWKPPGKKKTQKTGELTERQKRFVREYLVCLNATEAARRAGYSKRNAQDAGNSNLNRPHVKAAIQKAMDERAKRLEVKADRVLQELAKIAFADIKDFVYFGRDGVLLKEDSEVDGTVLAEITETVSRAGLRTHVKLHDKLKALDLLGRHLKLFTERHEVTGKDGGPIESVVTHKYAGLSDDELEKLIAEKAAKLAESGEAGTPKPSR